MEALLVLFLLVVVALVLYFVYGKNKPVVTVEENGFVPMTGQPEQLEPETHENPQ